MKPFDDMLPEEKEPQHEELITLLQRAYRRPVFVPPAEEEQIINRVRERLMETGTGYSLNEDEPVPQIGVLHSFPHKPVSPAGMPRRDLPLFRLITLLAAALVIAVLLGTPLLLLRPRFSSSGHHQPGNKPGSAPALTLSSSVANVGSTVTLTIEHFSDSSHIALSHDIQEPILINGNSSFITTDSKGMATVHLVINKDWGPGFHSIVAEDVATRYIASATLQITGERPTPLPHLLIDTIPINLGADVVGANTIHPFNLENKGGGSISWSASSNRSWLLISPGQGIFSQSQTISLAVQRAGLKPGDYTGSITISSNVSEPEHVEVDMTVQALPANAGAVLALPPALLSFTAIDGGPNPATQSLAISNPGSRPLNWSLAVNAPITSMPQVSPTQVQGLTCNWLSATPNRGTVAPGATNSINVRVQSKCLPPGVYTDTLKFTAAGGAYDGPQSVNVSVTVQPHCGIVTSSGSMSFNTVAGEGNLGNQTLNLSATASCAGSTLSWSATSMVPWLTVTPSAGQLKGTAGVVVSVSVNVGNLPVGQNQGMISFIAGQSTQTVIVQLNVQPTPSPAAPIMGASPLSINFSNIQGQPNPAGQVVTITNNGGSSLNWRTAINQSASNWLGAAPAGGVIAPGQTGQLTINVNTFPLTPGNYSGQITLYGYNSNGGGAPGSPQTITVNLTVQPPCSMSRASSRSLSFNAIQGGTTPASQTVMFTGTGSCAWPVTWNATTASSANWLTLTPANGTITGAGQSGSIGVAVNLASLLPNTYTTKVTISASDTSGGTVQGSSETFIVRLTLQSSCILSQLSDNLAFTVPLGGTAPAQPVTFNETGTCTPSVSWTATAGGASSSWLVLSPPSGTLSGTGSTLSVNVNSAGMAPGKYNGKITISAADSTGTAISGSPQTIGVTLTVTGFTVSGSVLACAAPAPCLPLPGARVRLMNGSKAIGAVTADASGNYPFSNIGPGSYTILVSGSDASHIHYVGSANVTVSGGNTTVPPIQAIPG